MSRIPLTQAQRDEQRKQLIAELEEKLATVEAEERLFHYHPNEDHIVLSHALFWVMTKNLKGTIAHKKPLLLLRKLQEEMLEDYLTESPNFPTLLHYCNVVSETFPYLLNSLDLNPRDIQKIQAIFIVSGGFGGDCTDEKCYELLDDINFHYNHVCCRKIEQFLPVLNQMVQHEISELH